MSTLLLPAAASLVLSGGQDPGRGGPARRHEPRPDRPEHPAGAGRRVPAAGEGGRPARGRAPGGARGRAGRARPGRGRAGRRRGRPRPTSTRRPPSSAIRCSGSNVQDASATSDVLFHQALADRADQRARGRRGPRRAHRPRPWGRHRPRGRRRLRRGGRHRARRRGTGDGPRRGRRPQHRGDRPARRARHHPRERRPAGAQPAGDARWQDYLAQLAAAGIEPPPAADLADADDLPSGLSPALDAAGPAGARASPGRSSAASPFTVLPAETVAAVSAALSQLGKPFAPATSGPDTYDCGGFTSAAWLLAGYAVPATPQDQWATGAAVPVSDPAGRRPGLLPRRPGRRHLPRRRRRHRRLGAAPSRSACGSLDGRLLRRRGSPCPRPPSPTRRCPSTAAPATAAPSRPPRATVDPSWGGYSNGQIPRRRAVRARRATATRCAATPRRPTR